MAWPLHYTYPWIVYSLVPLVTLIALLRWNYYTGVIYRYPLTTVLSTNNVVSRVPRKLVLTLIRFAILLLCVLLIAKPQWVDPKPCIEVDGIDIMLLLDISGSMSFPATNEDKRRRIDVAKQVAIRFINKRKNDALGLVLFGDDAISRCPLTTDKRVLLDMVNQVDIGMVPHEGTVITKALLTGINRLRYSKAKSKVIILLTDGEPTNNDLDPRIAIQAAQELGIKFYTVGIGDTKDMMMAHPLYGQVPVVTRVNSQLLAWLAQETGGTFFMAKQPDDMRRIYDTIDSLEKTRIEAPIFTRTHDWFIPLVWTVLLLVVIELLVTSWLWFGL